MTTFEQNLKHLIEVHHGGNISQAAIAMNINRTQLSRYLNENTWPREAQLRRICAHFGVDARILLDPLEGTDSQAQGQK